ncbi:hypothetical protein [Aeromicrobium sp.]
MRRLDPFLVLLLGAAALGSFLPATGTTFEVVRPVATVGLGRLFFL